MATSEIEKLERRYAENPHGLTFAPLAEVHRKNGDIARALELLTAGLELHPNYIPASIVLGRCHQDAGNLAAAEAAFAHVLRLDDENVIALKSLADINERLERYDLAEDWLRQLVLVDRSNDEAREQLRRIEARQSEAAAAGGKEASENENAAEAPASSPVLEVIDLSPEPATPAATFAGLAPDPPAATATREFSPAEESRAPPTEETPSAAQTDVIPEAEVLWDRVSVPPAEVPPSQAPISPEAEEPAASEETVEPLAGLISAEFQPPLKATGGLDVETSEEVVLEGSGNSEFRVPDASEDLKSVAARLAAPPPPPEVDRVEAQKEVAPAQEAPAMAPPEQPAKRRSYLARDTSGQSVGSFFRALLSARPPSEPGPGTTELSSGAGAAVSPSNPNGGPLAGLDEGVAPVPPAVPSGEASADAPVSFDDFFSPEPDGSPSRRQGESDSGGDDLDQFQSWLQNLKR